MSVINAVPLLASAGGGDYQISRSVRLRSSAGAYFNRTFGTPTDAKKQTLSFWMKRGIMGVSTQRIVDCYDGTSANSTVLYPSAGDALQFGFGGSASNLLVTNQVFRDPAGWYHIIVAIDTTQATASNRVLMYVNGAQVTSFSSATYPSLNAVSQMFGSGANNRIGSSWGGGNTFDGYLADFHFIDGQALTPAAFGETDSITGVWKPKAYTGTYGTNGFRLDFSDPTAGATGIGKDRAGSNNWTPNNISLTAGATYDSMLDVPTAYADGGNGRGNYCVMNPLQLATSSGFAVSDGNLKVSGTASGNATQARGTIAVSSGKWYWEILRSDSVTTAGPLVGVVLADVSQNTYVGSSSSSWTYYALTGNKFNAASGSAYGASWGNNDVVGVALDMDAGTITFYKNGVSQGTAFSNLAGTTVAPLVSGDQSGGVFTLNFNFGQRPFSYTPPTGFKALHTGNLPEPTIKKGNQYFDATTWTGNGAARSISNSGSLQPDLVWVKDRSSVNIENHWLTDSVRGVTKYLSSNLTDAEYTFTTAVTSFDAGGFSLGTDGKVNRSGDPYVAWQWKKGATPGFDVVTYTGDGAASRTIAHSLGVTPAMMIVKSRNFADNWIVWHRSNSTPTQDYLLLNSTNAKATSSVIWGNTAPTSSVFGVGITGSVGYTNQNAGTYVNYLFSEVAGFSKFGSYTGNGSSDGVFVHLGFKARYFLLKRTNAIADWFVYDTARNTINVMGSEIYPNSSSAEGTDPAIDVLANGVKFRNAKVSLNGSGDTYIYAAFAENPFKYSLAR